MKTVILSAFMLLSSSAFGFFTDSAKTHTISGSGSWKTAAGENGTYTVDLKVEGDREKGEATISETYHLKDGKEMAFSYRLAKGANGFFDVYKDEAKVGSGYCFMMAAKKTKVCHMGTKTAEGWAEQTLHMDLATKSLHRLGSFSHAGTKVAWADSLTHKYHHRQHHHLGE